MTHPIRALTLLLLALFTIPPTGCTTRQSVTANDISVKETKRTTYFLGVIPVFERDTRNDVELTK